MPVRERIPVFTEQDVEKPKPVEKKKTIVTEDDICDECLEGIVIQLFKLARHDMKVAIKKLQTLDMEKVREIYGKRYIGIKLTKKENGINMRYAAHFKQLCDVENFFLSEWAADLGMREGRKMITQIDQSCGYKDTEERKQALYLPTMLVEHLLSDEADFSEEDITA